jgi:adenylosuccinate synthase
MRDLGWFTQIGAHVLVDGQFGSTGKGLAEQALASHIGHLVDAVTTNAGPNSGHTIYLDDRKVVTKQIPSFSVAMAHMGLPKALLLNAGALVDPEILKAESAYLGDGQLLIHPHSTAILPKHYAERSTLGLIASTQKGTGPALSDKVMRDKFAAVENVHDFSGFDVRMPNIDWFKQSVFVSTAQGFSLGLNSGFFPYTTCRECTVQQALSDARIPARWLRKVISTHRVHPIRVGNTVEGTSGPCYPDQKELSWTELGVQPETTTVTGRIRRVFTWSDQQFIECLTVNEPDALFLNFINYLRDPMVAVNFVTAKIKLFHQVRGKLPDFVMLGFGKYLHEVHVAFDENDVTRIVFSHWN